jgi:Flp pilus assembly protein TadG
MRVNRSERAGVTAVECAIVYPPVLLLLIGLLVGAIGVFRYQEVASLARRASRYAAVHGTQYARDTGNPAATPTDIYNAAVQPNAASLDLSKLSYSVTYNRDNSPYYTTVVGGTVVATANTVTVTINYQWIPEAFLGGITLTSTSSNPMIY